MAHLLYVENPALRRRVSDQVENGIRFKPKEDLETDIELVQSGDRHVSVSEFFCPFARDGKLLCW